MEVAQTVTCLKKWPFVGIKAFSTVNINWRRKSQYDAAQCKHTFDASQTPRWFGIESIILWRVYVPKSSLLSHKWRNENLPLLRSAKNCIVHMKMTISNQEHLWRPSIRFLLNDLCTAKQHIHSLNIAYLTNNSVGF